ncbi:MAG: flagellar motor switch protein FliN [Ignavibacteriaceae bacterium]|jgi:flagellar motor switch protein FliN/FliY
MADNIEKDQNNDINNEEQQQAPEPEKDTNEDVQVAANVADFEDMEESNIRDKNSSEKLDFLKDLQLSVYIELGRTQMQIKDILELERGYVIELDKLASEPVDIFVNNKKIAEGEVVVIDKHFGIRITNLNEATNRLKGLY